MLTQTEIKGPPTPADARKGFSERLRSALEKQRKPLKPSYFARSFNLRAEGAEVTPHAARKWLVGESIPTQERIVILAKWLNVNAAWLRFGDDLGRVGFAPGAIPPAFSKSEEALFARIGSLSRPSLRVIHGMVDLLSEFEDTMGTQGHRSMEGARDAG